MNAQVTPSHCRPGHSLAIEIVGRFDYVLSDEVEGNEQALFDLRLRRLAEAGYHVVDSNLTVDVDQSPPVWGWVLYRGTTNDAAPRRIRAR